MGRAAAQDAADRVLRNVWAVTIMRACCEDLRRLRPPFDDRISSCAGCIDCPIDPNVSM